MLVSREPPLVPESSVLLRVPVTVDFTFLITPEDSQDPPKVERERLLNITLMITDKEFSVSILRLTPTVLRRMMLKSTREDSDSGPSASMTTQPSPMRNFTQRSTPLFVPTQPDQPEVPNQNRATPQPASLSLEDKWSEFSPVKAKVTEEIESLRTQKESRTFKTKFTFTLRCSQLKTVVRMSLTSDRVGKMMYDYTMIGILKLKNMNSEL